MERDILAVNCNFVKSIEISSLFRLGNLENDSSQFHELHLMRNSYLINDY